MDIVLHPIGYVENAFEQMTAPEEIAAQPSRIVLEPAYLDGLLGLDQVEKILVVYYFDRAHEVRLQLHPRDDQSKPLRGVFATRTPYRPNHLGVTVVRLVRIEGNVLTVEGLDALNRTPVLDIKPFDPALDGPAPDPHH